MGRKKGDSGSFNSPAQRPPAGTNPAERRMHRRYSATFFVWYKVLKSGGGELHEGLSYTSDFSDGGFGIVASAPITVGELVFLSVATQSGGNKLSCVCEVVFSGELGSGSYRLGLRIIAMPPDGHDVLKRMKERIRDA